MTPIGTRARPPGVVHFDALALWEIIFVLVILKIPVAYVGWVVWWAIKAEPELGTEGGTEGVNWQPWRRPSATNRLAVQTRPRSAGALA